MFFPESQERAYSNRANALYGAELVFVVTIVVILGFGLGYSMGKNAN